MTVSKVDIKIRIVFQRGYRKMRNRDMSDEAKAFAMRAMRETEGFEE